MVNTAHSFFSRALDSDEAILELTFSSQFGLMSLLKSALGQPNQFGADLNSSSI